MLKRCWVLTILSILMGLIFSLAVAGDRPIPSTDQPKVRVGTFRRTDVLVAFYKSTYWDQKLRATRAEHQKAKEQGDQAKVKELEAWGARGQEHAHRQLAGEATLDNVLEPLRAAMPAIAKEANVQLIVEEPFFHEESVELVDVTALLVKQFTPAHHP